VLHAEETERTHPEPERARDRPRRLPLLDVRLHLPLNEPPHRLPELLVLLGEDAHGIRAAATRARPLPDRAPALPAHSAFLGERLGGGRRDPLPLNCSCCSVKMLMASLASIRARSPTWP